MLKFLLNILQSLNTKYS